MYEVIFSIKEYIKVRLYYIRNPEVDAYMSCIRVNDVLIYICHSLFESVTMLFICTE
jgi:hypothetical protein